MIKIEDLKKTYPPSTSALRGIDLRIFDGDWTALMGPSGSGKTTLLNIVSALDAPSNGTVEIFGEEIGKLTDREMAVFRRKNIGMVFQQFHLIPYLTALENVEIAQYFHSMVDKDSAIEILTDLGLSERLNHIPAKLSGGEQQRVSIARALINEPKIILADEPTGNLDRKNGLKIMETLKELNEKGMTILMVTHDQNLASWGNRIISLQDGKVVNDTLKTKR